MALDLFWRGDAYPPAIPAVLFVPLRSEAFEDGTAEKERERERERERCIPITLPKERCIPASTGKSGRALRHGVS